MRWAMRGMGAALALLLVSMHDRVALAGPAGMAYRPPVDAPVVDRFRVPRSPYGPGNRGIDYATAAGTQVLASAPGQVTFAGAVGGRLHVVVLHVSGVRTSYSFLASTTVVRGQTVAAGQVLGATGPSLHFGARIGDTYIDPLLLLAGEGSTGPHLVPDHEPSRSAHGGERYPLEQLVRHYRPVVKVSAAAVAWARLGGPKPAG